jgi:hypothetical protein
MSSASAKAQAPASALEQFLVAEPGLNFSNPAEREKFENHGAALRAQCRPVGPAEEEVFNRYVFATFMSERSQRFEVMAQDLYLEDTQAGLKAVAIFSRSAALYDRRARASFKELQALQQDRHYAAIIQEEMLAAKLPIVPISPALPIARIQRTRSHRTSPLYTAIMLQELILPKNPPTPQTGQTK